MAQTGFTPIDLVILADKPTGPRGKRAILELLTRGGEIPVMHLDDSVEVVTELSGARNVTPIHLAIPRRGRIEYPKGPIPSFSNPCETEETVTNFLRRCIG